MKSNYAYSAAGAFAATVFLLAAREATSAGQTSALVRLQSTTPGVAQTGNANLSGTITAGQFQGGGAGLTSLTASNISSGTLSDARLSTNVALLNGVGQAFTTPKTFSASPSFTNATTPFIVTTTNKVGNLNADLLDNQTGLFYQDATNLTAGLLSDARLSTNVALLASNQTFTGQKTFSQFPSFSNATVPFSVTSTNMVGNLNAQYLAGQGAGYYKDATNLTTGTLSDARLSTNVATLSGVQTFTGQKTFGNGLKIPTGAQSGHVLTSDAVGTATWQAPSSPVGGLIATSSPVPPTGYSYTGMSHPTEAVGAAVGTIPKNLARPSLGGIGSKVYVAGWNILANQFQFYSYDAATNITTRLADTISEVHYLVGAQGYVYSVNGEDGKVYRYNVATNVWQFQTLLPFSVLERWDYLVSSIGPDLMVFGGQDATGTTVFKSTFLWRSGSWQQKGDTLVPVASFGAGAVSGNGSVYCFGNASSQFGTEVQAYVDFTDSWVYVSPFLPGILYEPVGTLWDHNGVQEFFVFSLYNGAGYRANFAENVWRESPGFINISSIHGYGLNIYAYPDQLVRLTPPERFYFHRKN